LSSAGRYSNLTIKRPSLSSIAKVDIQRLTVAPPLSCSIFLLHSADRRTDALSGGAETMDRFGQWLDWWCESRWRSFAVWAALTIGSIFAFTSPLSVQIMEGADVAIHVFRRWLSLSSIDLSLVWDWSVSVFALTWFQPVLLRLDRKRGVAWIVGFTAWPAIVGLLFGFDWEYVHFAHFMFAISALTAVLLLKGQRTRPWLGVIAAFGYLIGMSLSRSADIIDYKIVWILANMFFGAVLLFGTERRTGDARAEV